MLVRALIVLFLTAGLTGLRAAAPSTPYGANPAAGHHAQINGIRLYYEVYGTGAPLVVLHGNGGSMAALRYQIEFFRATRQVIAIDSRGHGQSEMGTDRLTYEQIADDVAALLGQLRSPPADAIGWSDGGIVGLCLALRHPSAVRRLAISGANLSPAGLKPDDLAGMKKELAEVDRKRAAGDRTEPWDKKHQYLQMMIEQPNISRDDLARIRVPTLVLAGEHDMIPEPHTREIAAGLPHATLHFFPKAGHAALMEIPDTFNALVAEFFGAPDSRP